MSSWVCIQDFDLGGSEWSGRIMPSDLKHSDCSYCIIITAIVRSTGHWVRVTYFIQFSCQTLNKMPEAIYR